MQAISRVRRLEGCIRSRAENGARVELHDVLPVFPALMYFPHLTRAWAKGMLLKIYNCLSASQCHVGISLRFSMSHFILNPYLNSIQ